MFDTRDDDPLDTFDDGPFDTGDDTTESETFGDTTGGDWGETGNSDTEGNEEFVGCGPLSFEWDPASTVVGPDFGNLGGLERRPNGGMFGVTVDIDTATLMVIDPDGGVELSATRPVDADPEGLKIGALAEPDGGYVWGSSVGNEAFVTGLSAELEDEWTWTHPTIEWGMAIRDLARTASGNIVVVGEHWVDDYMWMVILSPEGQPVSPILGGPLTEEDIYAVAPSGVIIDPLTDDIIVSGWDVQPGYNDTWVARFDNTGNLMWETELSGEMGFGGGPLVDDQGRIFAVFDGIEGIGAGGIHELSPEGEELAHVHFPGNVGAVGLLDGRDILTAGWLSGNRVLRRYSAELELIEVHPLFDGIARSMTPGPNCRVAVGGSSNQLTQLGADVL